VSSVFSRCMCCGSARFSEMAYTGIPGMSPMSKIERDIQSSVRENCILFLRRSASEILLHDDTRDAPFTRETATMVTVLTQMALELAVIGYLIKHEGLRSVLQNGDKLSDDDIKSQWRDNTLRTNIFENNKKLIRGKHSYAFDCFEGVVDEFQTYRNKIMHIFYKFSDRDMYKVKYDSLYIVMNIIIHLLEESDYAWPETASAILSSEIVDSLSQNIPYKNYVKNIAKEYSSLVLKCVMCNNEAYSNTEGRCFFCGYEHPTRDLVKCKKCGCNAVIYDVLNIDINESLPSLCLKCGNKSRVFKCPECKCVYTYDKQKICEFCS
jgi:hypothetical protein